MKKYLLSTLAVVTILIASLAMMSPSGEALKKEEIPKGTIVAWSPEYGESTQCPSGWKIADGTDNTPDLREKFLLGSTTGDADKKADKYIGKSVGHDGDVYEKYYVPAYSVVYIIKQ